MCVLPNAGGHIWNPTYELINDESCDKIGRRLETEAKAIMKKYPLQNVLFYVQIPYIKDHVMSRLFQHLITDLGIQFSSNDYLKRLMGNVVSFQLSATYSMDKQEAVEGYFLKEIGGEGGGGGSERKLILFHYRRLVICGA